MSFRIANNGDLKQIVYIYNQAIAKKNATADLIPYTVYEKQSWFDNHISEKYPIFVYEIKDEVVAWLSFSPYREGRQALEKTIEISYYVQNEHQGKGIGGKIMEFALDYASQQGIENLLAILLSVNFASINLLSKFGFEQWGLLPNIANINGKYCSHLYMGKKLPLKNEN